MKALYNVELEWEEVGREGDVHLDQVPVVASSEERARLAAGATIRERWPDKPIRFLSRRVLW